MKPIKLTSRKDILEVLEKKNIKISSYTEDIISKIEFTEGVEYNITILKVKDILPEGESYLTAENIRKEAERLGYKTPHPEVGLLLRDYLSDEYMAEMGLDYVMIAHKPIKDSVGDPFLLCVSRYDDGRWLYAVYGSPDYRWYRGYGFAFVSQVGSSDLDLKSAIEIKEGRIYNL